MSIRFKFRSSVNFDSLEIGERASIAVGELRARILKGKTSHQHQGFDLVFSDADSSLEFKGDDCQIPSGSSVIVRRVPAGTMPLAVSPVQAVKNVEMKKVFNLSPGNGPTDGFDASGADLCAMPDSTFPDFNQVDKNAFLGNGTNQMAGLRTEGQKQGPGDLSQETPRGGNQSGNVVISVRELNQQREPINPPISNFPVVQCSNLPVEMKCTLCNSFFKDAVMILCCQHSFCHNCIRQVLIEKRRCPKCFSSKCHVEDLLPNLSLRQAIERFLKAEILDDGIENTLQKYVPDGESGIQVRDFSCAPSVVQREIEFPQSSSATGNGSNQLYRKASLEQNRQIDVPVGSSGNRDIKSALPSQKVNQIDDISGDHLHNDMRSGGPEDFVLSADFQGENQPVNLPTNVPYKADYNTRRRGGPWTGSGGEERNFMGHGGHRKSTRNCYTCGSPDHLMRDCPMPRQNPMFQPGHGAFHGGMSGYVHPPYWNGSSMPPFRPYPNMYGNPGMMQFNTSMVPVSPFALPPYFPSMGSSMLGPGGNMGMGNMGPPHPDHFGLQLCENKRKHPSEALESKTISEEDESPERYQHHATPERSHDHRPHKEDKPGLACSDDSFPHRLAGKHQHDMLLHEKVSPASNPCRDKRIFHRERSNSGKEEVSRSSEGRHRLHHHGESRRHHERKGHCESESSHSRHSDAKRRPEPDVRGSHGSPPADRRREYNDHSRHARKQSREESRALDRERDDDYRHHKRRAD